MSEPFLAEIKMFGFNFAPPGWAHCDGQTLPINQNQSLYSLLGTIYGGDGETTFRLPDLRSRTPAHVGNGHTQGSKFGQENVSLTAAQIPPHRHLVNVSNTAAGSSTVAGSHLATNSVNLNLYNTGGTPDADMAPGMVSSTGGQSHNNMMPFNTLNFCIAIQGTFPSEN